MEVASDEKSTYKQMLVSLNIDTNDKDLKGNKLYRLENQSTEG